MSDQSNTPEDQDQSQAEPEEEQQLRQITEEDLEKILADHGLWLGSKGVEGKQANLSYCDLHGVNLDGSNLSQADLSGANLEGASLVKANLKEALLCDANLRAALMTSANLQGANLFEADITKAYLVEADLRGANMMSTEGIREAYLDDCNMGGVTGLKGDEFAGADVTGAKLPDDIAKWQVLDVVAETSKNARKIFLAMLLGCVYSWLTIASTTDANLLTNSASSPLPIIGTAVPISWFYWAAPLLLVGLYFYLHFYLQRLWENLAGLPAIFEDGKRLDQRAYPWLLNGLVRRHFDQLRGRRTPLQRLEEWITIVLAWWVVPLTLLWFWVRYLPRHDWGGSGLQVGVVLAATAVGFAFYTTHARTLRGDARLKLTWKTAWKDTRIWRTVGSLALGAGLIALSYGSINGMRYPYREDRYGTLTPPNMNELPTRLCARVPAMFAKLGYSVFADLHEAVVSRRPDNYWELDPALRDSSVTGANLARSDLRESNLKGAFLARADLQSADLCRSHLEEANLAEAKLDSAQLVGTSLYSANLAKASFFGADLSHVVLAEADLRGADLRRSILENANMNAADLRGANLWGTSLKNASMACADLSGAVFWDKLRPVTGLTQSQLDEACGDSLTVLPPGLTIKPCPCEDSVGVSADEGS